MIKWKSEKTAPKDGKHILSWDGDQCMVVMYCGCKRKWYVPEEHGKPHVDAPMDWEFTHWTPLPEPPA